MSNTITQFFANQLKEETNATRAMLERVPAEQFTWQPHPKSMTLLRLATHVAEIPGWAELAIDLDMMDYSKSNYLPAPFTTQQQLLDFFEARLAAGIAAIDKTNDETLEKNWRMCNGEQLYFEAPKKEVLRMSFSQLIHHRAQLGVYLRLLDIPIPGSYGPSADEMPV